MITSPSCESSPSGCWGSELRPSWWHCLIHPCGSTPSWISYHCIHSYPNSSFTFPSLSLIIKNSLLNWISSFQRVLIFWDKTHALGSNREELLFRICFQQCCFLVETILETVDKSDLWKSRTLWKLPGSSRRDGVANLLGKVGREVFLEYATDQKHQGKGEAFYRKSSKQLPVEWVSVLLQSQMWIGTFKSFKLRGKRGVRLTPPVPFGQWLPSIFKALNKSLTFPIGAHMSFTSLPETRGKSFYLAPSERDSSKQDHICGFQWQAFLLPTWKAEISSDLEKGG